MQKLLEPSHLPTVMIHKEIPGVVLFPVGDLQSMGMSYLLCLEGGIQVLDVDDCFGGFTLEERKPVLKILMAIGALWSVTFFRAFYTDKPPIYSPGLL